MRKKREKNAIFLAAVLAFQTVFSTCTAQAGSEKISLSWSACKNITCCEICIKQGSREEAVFTTANSIDIKTFGRKELKNYTEYTLSVQSVNGTWRSGYNQITYILNSELKLLKRAIEPINNVLLNTFINSKSTFWFCCNLSHSVLTSYIVCR